MKKKPYLKLIVGPMFSGKSDKLIDEITKLSLAKVNVLTFTPKANTRDEGKIKSRTKKTYKAIEIDDIKEINNYINDETQVIIFDEIQFFKGDVVKELDKWAYKLSVLASGLPSDSDHNPFLFMGDLMAIADEIDSLHAICVHEGCGRKATMTKFLGDKDSVVVVDNGNNYIPVCRRHFK